MLSLLVLAPFLLWHFPRMVWQKLVGDASNRRHCMPSRRNPASAALAPLNDPRQKGVLSDSKFLLEMHLTKRSLVDAQAAK